MNEPQKQNNTNVDIQNNTNDNKSNRHKRQLRKRLKNIDKYIPFLSVVLGFLVGAIIMILSGYNPVVAYYKLFQGAGLFGDVRRFGEMLNVSTTLILVGLSIAFGMRTGLFNIGASGQFLMGGFFAVGIGVIQGIPAPIHMPLAVFAAFVGGGLWGMIPGILKSKFNIHEVVSGIMMNWIAVWTVYYFVPLYMKGKYDTESTTILQSASLRSEWLSNLFNRSNVHYGLFIALITAVIVWWILEKTTFGYELKAVGFNKEGARYAGIKVERKVVQSLMISGAIAGLAGAAFYLGFTDHVRIGELPGIGFDGIAVSLLGLNAPLGVVMSAILFGILNSGKGFMQASTGVPNELVQIIMAVIIFFAAAKYLIKLMIEKMIKEDK